MAVTVGAIFRPQVPPEELKAAVQAAERAGLAELWLWEDCFLESGIASAAAALAWSDSLVVGIGLIPTPLRNVALAAMEIATLERMFPGRIRIALGHGVQEWMGQSGVRAASPLTLMREYVVALRALLAGESVTTQGDYVNLTDVVLGWPPESCPPLLIGATGPRTLHLAGEIGDGVVLDSVMTPERVVDALATVDEGAGGRSPSFSAVVYLRAFLGDGAAEQLVRETEPSAPGAPRGHGLVGEVDRVAEEVRRMAAAGASTVVLQPSATQRDMEAYWDFATTVAREVQ